MCISFNRMMVASQISPEDNSRNVCVGRPVKVKKRLIYPMFDWPDPDSLKARLDTKAEATAVVSEMDRLRGDVGEEFRKTRLEIESTFRELTAQAQSAFQQVGVV